jgi:hypothetical protein
MKRETQRYTLSLLILTQNTLLLGALVFLEIPAANERIFDIAMGSLLTLTAGVAGFYYSSSPSSSTKDDTISSLANMGERLLK